MALLLLGQLEVSSWLTELSVKVGVLLPWQPEVELLRLQLTGSEDMQLLDISSSGAMPFLEISMFSSGCFSIKLAASSFRLDGETDSEMVRYSLTVFLKKIRANFFSRYRFPETTLYHTIQTFNKPE